ncbi:hypothetical protein BJY52DRAFT_1418510 [Lactarius psammicola]|nr:hypothetical protein BJY52DRAFT_1418510 [Lactarius psammicola]
MALASGVAASATPVRRDPPFITPDQCIANNWVLTCCGSSIILPITDPLATLLVPLGQNLNILVGLNCVVIGTVACGTQQSLCCESVLNQQGLVNIGINCIPVAL